MSYLYFTKIIVHGSKSSTQDLESACQGIEYFTKEIFTPSVGEVLNVSAATNIYRVKLTDSMVSSLQFSKVMDQSLLLFYQELTIINI